MNLCRIIIIFVIFFVISILAVDLFYIYISKNKSELKINNFKDVAPYQQYLLDPMVYNPSYINSLEVQQSQAQALYNVPGSTADPYMLYSGGYMPYESVVPAIDVMRVNANISQNKLITPAYYNQYVKQNTTPFANREIEIK